MKRAEKSISDKNQLRLFSDSSFGNGICSAHGTDVIVSTGGAVRQEWISRCTEERALSQDMLNDILSLSNLVKAVRQVVKNKGAGGVDGMKVKELESWFNKNYGTFTQTVLRGTYQCSPVLGVEIPKANGGRRLLGIPTAKDRVLHQAIAQVLTEHYDPTFSESSFGFRKGRGTSQALGQACDYVDEGNKWAVDIDLANFFNEVNHDRLLWLLSRRIGDQRLLKLIGKILRSGILLDGLVSQHAKGTPQGSPLSPLLSNIVLDELDKELEHRGHKFIRYADDLIILCKSERSAQRVWSSVSTYIESRLLLRVNAKKSRVCWCTALNYLGHSLLGNGTLGLSKRSESRLKAKLRAITRRSRGVSLWQIIKELGPVLRGWFNYFHRARMKSKLLSIMGWLRRRLRCFRFKQCKSKSGIHRFLRSIGVAEKWVKGSSWTNRLYRASHTHTLNAGMNNTWFREQGLFDLHYHYCQIT